MFLSGVSGRFLLLNTFGTMIFRWSAGNHFIKTLHVHVSFISEHFDWMLCIISDCDWMNYF